MTTLTGAQRRVLAVVADHLHVSAHEVKRELPGATPVGTVRRILEGLAADGLLSARGAVEQSRTLTRYSITEEGRTVLFPITDAEREAVTEEPAPEPEYERIRVELKGEGSARFARVHGGTPMEWAALTQYIAAVSALRGALATARADIERALTSLNEHGGAYPSHLRASAVHEAEGRVAVAREVLSLAAGLASQRDRTEMNLAATLAGQGVPVSVAMPTGL